MIYSPPPQKNDEDLRSFFSRAPSDVSNAQQAAGAQAPLGPQLDNGDRTLTPPTSGELGNISRRRKAWALRDVSARLLRPEDPTQRGPSVCGCGKDGFQAEEVTFHLREDGTAKAGGILHCDSAWLCPVCAPKKGKERQERMAKVFDHVKAYSDGQMVMATVTVQHDRKDALEALKRAVQVASRKARQGKPWRLRKERHNVIGVISAPEVTWSEKHGWHFHIHTAILLHGTGAEAEELGRWFIGRYMSYIRLEGYRALVQGQDVTLIKNQDRLAEYLSKGVSRNRDLAWEMAGQATKKARGDGLHPFEILEAASGNPKMTALWLEYAAAMKGTRSCVVTKAIAETLGIEPDEDDETPTEELPEPEDDVIGSLPTDIWNTVMSRFKGSTMLAILEDGGAKAWPQAEAYAFKVAELPFPTDERIYAPDAADIAKEAISESWQVKSKGLAVRKVLDRHRGIAVAKGATFIPPPLKRVLELVSS